MPDSFLQRRIGDVPYLNGGLFEKSDDGTDDSDAGITIPDEAIVAVLGELFDRFNFTVTESTPLDVEVAVDPEMLGKVFEELVTGRHESGSYYTPKPIVSFMCREALKGHLETRCPGESGDAIAAFVDEHDATRLRDGEAVLDALKTIRCCDPACGSGAYLLGMMHELLDLRASLFASNKKLDAVKTYERKLEIIQTNVYGVDLDPFAINIARLRLWLSLVVEFDWENGRLKVPPLPNLDFKVEAGDSLAAPDPSGGFDPGLNKVKVDEFIATKAKHATADPLDKKTLLDRAKALRIEIRLWYRGKSDARGFDWPIEFPEVFQAGGFDVVLANPPYVRQELIKDQKPTLKANIPLVFTGVADLYVFFYARALQCLRPGGVMAFISSNKWFRAGYGKKLREHIARTTSVRSIVDFHDLPVFETAIAYPMIFVAANRPAREDETPILAEPPDLEPPYPDVAAVVATHGHRMPTTALGRDGTWHLATSSASDRLKKMRAAGVTLREHLASDFFRGLSTGLNDAFIIDSPTREILLRDSSSRDVIKPYLAGRDVKRWAIHHRDLWIIYAPWDMQLDRYPAIKKHLRRFEVELKDRPECREGRYNWWCMARYGSDYVSEFKRPKIISTKVSIGPTFAFDTRGHYLGNTSYFASIDKDAEAKYLLGVLNSLPSKLYALETFVGKQSGWYEVQPSGLEQMPIPTASPTERDPIAALAQKCLDARGEGCEAWEKEIDERVAALHGL